MNVRANISIHLAALTVALQNTEILALNSRAPDRGDFQAFPGFAAVIFVYRNGLDISSVEFACQLTHLMLQSFACEDCSETS